MRLKSIESVNEEGRETINNGKQTNITFNPDGPFNFKNNQINFADVVQYQIDFDETMNKKQRYAPTKVQCNCHNKIKPNLEKQMTLKREIFSQQQKKR